MGARVTSLSLCAWWSLRRIAFMVASTSMPCLSRCGLTSSVSSMPVSALKRVTREWFGVETTVSSGVRT